MATRSILVRSMRCLTLSQRVPSFPNQLLRGMAGHSKFANRKHIKAEKSKVKDARAGLIVRKIGIAIRESGISDPKLNSSLAKVMDEAKSLNVPFATVNDAIKRMTATQKAGSTLVVEARGVAGCNLIIEMFSDKHIKARQSVTAVLKKVGGAVGSAGSSSYAFDKKAVLTVTREGLEMDLDGAMEHAIDCGAEDVDEAEDEDEGKVFRFLCDPSDMNEVKKNLTDASLPVVDSRVEYIPHTFVPVPKDNEEILEKMFSLLENVEEITDVFDNAKIE
ncbi:hypothetical protein CAPTEDRAFT_219541 [Capitella teleta]|uniref:Transcriptional regulatory protein n=1 Tax=Capitella teleta TaxID=283909 RepID=R7VFA5_CAPTE|nr:hypothetical protein CAPTEDRAFT_219541 [Capitella teleta]|eukprot:ELU17294.1 hypothetical protein CAPTEDRAFT_219541 [Capitella teleta]